MTLIAQGWTLFIVEVILPAANGFPNSEMAESVFATSVAMFMLIANRDEQWLAELSPMVDVMYKGAKVNPEVLPRSLQGLGGRVADR